MSILETIKFLKSYENTVVNSDEFVQVNNLSDEILKIRESIEQNLVSNGNYSINGVTYLQTIKGTIDKAIRNFSAYKAGQKLSTARVLLNSIIPEVNTLCNSHLDTIQDFLEKLENNKFANKNNISDLYQVCQLLISARFNLKNYLKGLEDSILLLQQYKIMDGEANLSLTFHPISNNLEFHIKVSKMIFDIYTALCDLTDTSITKFPLILQSHFSGSDSLTISGNSGLIKVLGDVIYSAGTFLKENYTNAGEFEKLSKQFEETEKQLLIIKSLEENGFNVSSTREVLQKNLSIIALALNENLILQYKIKIDEKEIEIIPEKDRALPFIQRKLPGKIIDEKG